MKTILSGGVDESDVQILDLLIQNQNNKHISTTLKIPLSTVQRRVRKLVEKGFVTPNNYIDFTKFGFKSGSLHIYLKNGNVDTVLEKVSKLKGVTSIEVHIGNSDIIAGIAYKEGRDLFDIIVRIKKWKE